MTWKDPRTWSALAAFLLVLALAAVVPSMVVDQRSEDRGKERQVEAVRACERGNLVRGYLLLRARELPPTKSGEALAPAVFAIINCDETVHHRGNAVNLNGAEAERYLQILVRRRMPIVSEDGRVTGERALPAI